MMPPVAHPVEPLEPPAPLPTALRWPPERFYWAVLEVPPAMARPRVHPIPAGLLDDLAERLPEDLAELHTVGSRAGAHHLLVCAARADLLRGLPRDTMSLRPSAPPPGVPEQVRVEDLELLVGAFLPRGIKRRRRLGHALGLLTLLGSAVLIALGFEHRASVSKANAQQFRAAREELAEHAGVADLAVELDRSRALQAGLQRLGRHAAGPADAADALAQLLRAWPPGDPGSQPHAVLIDAQGVSLSLSLPSPRVANLVTQLGTMPGWSMDEPRLSASEDQTRLTLRLQASERHSSSSAGSAP